MYWKHKTIIRLNVLIFAGIVCIYRFTKIQNDDLKTTGHTYDISDAETERIIRKADRENLDRLAHIQSVCKSYKLGKYKSSNKRSNFPIKEPLPHYEVFYYDVKDKLSWCPIYKAGSTTWLYHFVTLGGSTEQDIKDSKLQISQFVRKLFLPLEPTAAIKFLPLSLKFLIVRHPFERILSAYRDKLESVVAHTKNDSLHYYKKFGRKIVLKYRPGGNNTNVRSLLKAGQYLWTEDKKPPLGIEPTFKEFVRYLIDTDLIQRSDDHWIPYYLYCTPCSIAFDVIGKVETMFADQLLIIHKAGVHELLKPKWKHKTNPLTTSKADKISEIAKIYFSQLNSNDTMELYRKYKLDFELFQYNPDEYINYVLRLGS